MLIRRSNFNSSSLNPRTLREGAVCVKHLMFHLLTHDITKVEGGAAKVQSDVMHMLQAPDMAIRAGGLYHSQNTSGHAILRLMSMLSISHVRFII